MKLAKICLLLTCCMTLASCSPESEEAVRPLNLALHIDQAQVSGDAADFVSSRKAEAAWREVFREDFTAESWLRWTPAPNQVPPPRDSLELLERWQAAVERLQGAAALVADADDENKGAVLQVEGSFDLQWVGYVVPVPVQGGRRYRISSRIKTEQVEVRNPQRFGYVGFLELDKPLQQQEVYSAADLAPYILADQKSPGAPGVDSDWRDESFVLTLHEATETLLLYVCVYHGEGMSSGRVLFDDLLVEELAVQPLPAYLQQEYLTPWTSRVTSRSELFKVAGWGNPTELSHHLEGLVSPGESRIVFPLDGKKYATLSFSYGPLREFSTLATGELSFHVEVNGQEVFADRYDFRQGEGKQGWRQQTLPLHEGVQELALVTKSRQVDQPVVGFWGAPLLSPEPTQPQRSVLVVCVDSLRKDFIDLYGGVNAMPVFAELAKDGLSYDNYLSAGNTTRYALTALMTGEYAGRNGLHLDSVYAQLSPTFRKQFARRVATLPGWFRDHGYLTFASIDNPFFLPVTTGLHMGFSEIHNVGAAEGAYTVITDQTIDFMERHPQQPVFAFVHYDTDYLSKWDLSGTPGVEAAQLKAAYFLELERISDQIQRLITKLRQSGRYESMDIVLVSDHGESLDPSLTGHGYHLSPDQVMVPLVIKPARMSPLETGRRIPGVISSVDLAPWLAKEHNLAVPDDFTGEPGAVAGEQALERIIYSEGINQHQLLISQPKGTYLLHRDGSEEMHGVEKDAKLLTDFRHEAIDFLTTARPGLFIDVGMREDEVSLVVELEGAQQVQIVGLKPEDEIVSREGRLFLTLSVDKSGRVLIVPEDAITYPCRVRISSVGEQVAIGLSPDFLPIGQGELFFGDAEQLHMLLYPSVPQVVNQKDQVLAWYSPGAGVRAVSSSPGQLDPAMRSMLKRWGYLK